jgi:hypothetical protein
MCRFPRRSVQDAARQIGPTEPAQVGPDVAQVKQQLAQALIQQPIQHAGQQADFTPILQALGQLKQAREQQQAEQQTAPMVGPGLPQKPLPSTPNLPGNVLAFLSSLGKQYGVPVTSTTEGQHAPHSYHYQGRAEDYGGHDYAKLAQLYAYALAHPKQFKEAFYTGPGAKPYYVKNGQELPIGQLDPGLRRQHANHVHLAR